MKLKSIYGICGVALLLISGCATQRQLAGLEGRGRQQTYDGGFDRVWRAAVDAAQQGELEVVNADKNNGYIAARRGYQIETFGENVGVWVRPIGTGQTQVEVVSRQAGPPKFWFKNWENEVHRAIAANLTRDVAGTVVDEPAAAEYRREVIRNQPIIERSREVIVEPDVEVRRSREATIDDQYDRDGRLIERRREVITEKRTIIEEDAPRRNDD